ncbi:MAG: hypothetical protein HY815_00490 [Candidatus Riflebacteria bacterium]|nr:hypothetical protein [Candidatus Riflebacteria bacterium]
MNVIKGRRRELLAVALVVAFIWGYKALVLGEMRDEIEKINSPNELPAKKAVLAVAARVEKDAQEIAFRLDTIRRSPLMGQNLATTLEQFHKRAGLSRERARLVPRGVQMLEGNLQEESVEVLIGGMALEEIIKYLQEMETLGHAVRVRRLQIQKTQDTANVIMVVAALKVM